MKAMARFQDSTMKMPCLTVLRQILSGPPLALRRMRSRRRPSTSRSMGRNTPSMNTVCGQAKPHHTRPKRLVTTNSPRPMPISTKKNRWKSWLLKLAPNR